MSVGPVIGPVQRPGDDRDFSEIFRRLTDLERARSGGSGWQFNVENGVTPPQGYGLVETTDSLDYLFGILGLQLGDATTQGTFLYSRDDPMTKLGSLLITPDTIVLSLDEKLTLEMDRAAGTVTLYGSTGNKMMQMTDGSPDLHLPAGGNVVFDLT